MPSGKMHLGHSMVIEQVRWFQEHGADVTVAVADLEALATRGTSLSSGRETAIREYVHNYAALGLDPEKTNVYFQSSRPVVQRPSHLPSAKGLIYLSSNPYMVSGRQACHIYKHLWFKLVI